MSPDSMDSDKKFVEKLDIPFLLLSDPDKTVGKKYGVFKEKGLKAKIGLDMERSTFIIDKEGNLAKEYRDVKVKGHAEDVLGFIKENM